MIVMLDRNATLLQVDADAGFACPVGECFPHLSGAEAGVPKFLDQGRHVLLAKAKHRKHRLPEREVLDSLCRPQRSDLRARDSPDLLRVRPEERVVEAAAE